MTPGDIAARHPVLWHLAEAEGAAGIAARGLWPAADLVALFGADPRPVTERRPGPVVLRHPVHGVAVLNDNRPLSMRALARCLDDGLTPRDWLAMLNARVFFWPDRRRVDRLAAAAGNAGRRKVLYEVDTRSLLDAHADRAEITPINSGSTVRRAARRGLSTFTPIGALTLANWRRARGGRDSIAEVAVRGPVPDFTAHVRGMEAL
jgi:hypothetical protein